MDVLDTLAKRGAILKYHHFIYKSGKHGAHYINMDPMFPDTAFMRQICGELGWKFNFPHRQRVVDTVVGAATGAIPLAYLTALSIEAQTAWADKDGEDFAFERAGFVEQLTGKRVLIVEDLLNTGDTVKKVIAQARKHGADVVGVSVICNRGNETAESLGVPLLEQLASVKFVALDADTCQLCADSVPIVEDIGHGKEYKQVHADYAGGYIKLLSE